MKVLISIAFLAALTLASAADIRVAFSGDRPPFSFRIDSHDVGIEVDVVREAFKKMDRAIAIVIVPNSRLPVELENGHVDMAAAIHDRNNSQFCYSDEFVEYTNFAISKHRKHIQLSSIADLSKYDFTIWQDGWRDLGAEFEAAYKPDAAGAFPHNYHEAASQESQAKMFWAGRTDLIIVDRDVFTWYRRQLAPLMMTNDEVIVHDVFKTHTAYSVASRDKGLCDLFNRGLQAIRSDGTYERILERYR